MLVRFMYSLLQQSKPSLTSSAKVCPVSSRLSNTSIQPKPDWDELVLLEQEPGQVNVKQRFTSRGKNNPWTKLNI